MARVHPSNLELLRVEASNLAEVHTLDQLAHHLSDDYTVFHSLHFAYLVGRRQRFGEIDFVIVNRSGHLLLVEQKNGELIEGDDAIHKQYTDERKDVVAQVLRGRETVLGQLAAVVPDVSGHPVHVLLYCPDHELRNAGTSGLPRSAIVDATERSGLEAWIDRTLGPGGGEAYAETAERVRSWARRALDIEPDLGASIERQGQTYARIAGGLTELVDGLELSPWRLRVQASAGSGKSLAAQHAFRKARKEGRHPLLLCFNSVLAATLQESLGERRDVGTFHHWCRRMLEANGRPFDQTAAGDPAYWKRMVQEVIDCDPPEPRYDTFIIDEAQDFDPDWWALLECLGADEPDARILCFEDAQQDLYGRSGVPLESCATYRSRAIYRTPQRIARFIDKVLKPDVDWRSPYDGLPVRVHAYRDEAEQLELIAERIDALIEAGFAPEQILVLSMHGRSSACFERLESIGAHRLRKFTGGFTDDGQPLFTAGQVEAETIYRFKGNQRPAVVIVDVDELRATDDRVGRLLYCALTRATVATELVVQLASPAYETLLAAG